MRLNKWTHEECKMNIRTIYIKKHIYDSHNNYKILLLIFKKSAVHLIYSCTIIARISLIAFRNVRRSWWSDIPTTSWKFNNIQLHFIYFKGIYHPPNKPDTSFTSMLDLCLTRIIAHIPIFVIQQTEIDKKSVS